MDKFWMRMDRLSPQYIAGVEEFLKFASQDAERRKLRRIFCPCEMCVNKRRRTVKDVRYDLFLHGIMQDYTCWTKHGEDSHASSSTASFGNRSSSSHEFEEGSLADIPDHTIDDAPDYIAEALEMIDAAQEDNPGDPSKFEKLVEDAKKPLFPGDSKVTKLSATIKLLNLKAKHGVSDKCFSELLDLLKNEILPDGNEMPASTYEARKSINPLGFDYVKIHACPNDCILYRKDHEKAEVCPICKESRWKKDKITSEVRKGVPVKVLWYFPIIPRLIRLFLVKDTAEKLIWHDRDRKKDGLLRHPADAKAWKAVDERYPDFAKDPRNIRLGVSADGVNPFRGKKKNYSCWPILTVVYNLPPWLCMKRKFMMLTMLIQGPKEPGNDIDVFLAPLVDDLKLLFDEGVEAYDAYKQERFMLRVVVLWTVSDYPALGNLCGCPVSGYHGCAVCGVNTHSTWLKYSRKVSFTGHRKWLPAGHRYRNQMKPFDGHQEFGVAPEPLSGVQKFEEAKLIENSWGKKSNGKRTLGKSTRSEFEDSTDWKKLSIWAKELEYFKYHLVQHNLDLMHTEKNVCESFVGTLLNISKLSKDGYKARMDLNDLKIRPELEPVDAGKRKYLPPACYTLTKEEKMKFCKTLYELKVPEGYCSNFSSLVSLKELKLIGLKSHDYHVLMQQFLPLAVRSILPKNVRNTIIRLSSFFNSICKKEIDIAELTNLQRDLVETLCLLEKYFPPSFFDVMIHLTVHLVREVELGGPVFTRWMYPFERYMKVMKGWIRNKNRAEGCIANCYELEEFVEFAADWLSGMETIGIPPLKHTGTSNLEGSSLISEGRPLRGGDDVEVDRVLLSQAHLIVLHNTEEVKPYIDQHMSELKQQYAKKSRNEVWLQDKHNKTFISWLHKKVEQEIEDEDDIMAEENKISKYLKWISQAPRHIVIKYNGYDINGCRYRTKSHDGSVNQNSGVSLEASGMHIASAKDSNPKIATSRYYGVINEIWVLDYHCIRIPVFLCDWVDSGYGVKTDELGYTLVDLKRLGHKKDRFILATQANQVFYVNEQGNSRWSVVLSCPLKDYIDDDDIDENDGDELMFHSRRPEVNMAVDMDSLYVDEDSDTSYVRDGGQGIYVDPSFED